MENATKALLIAAAILIAIVLVSIGVFVLRQGNDAMNTVDMSEAQILAFNSNFESYTGTQRGSQVKALLDRIKSSNAKSDDSAQITFATGSSIANTDANVNTSAFYTVSFQKNTTTGLIEKVKITGP